MKITAIIPTFNEEENIKGAIETISFADEIIVIDSYSTDKTVEIAKTFNVNVILREFDDFSTQKNFAISKAKNDWIYLLDADERVTDELKDEILAVEPSTNYVGFIVYRTFYFIGRKIKRGGWERDKVIRLFNRNYCKYNGNLVHETISADGELAFFKSKLEHYSYRGFDHYISKLNQYAQLRAEQLNRKGKKVTFFHIVIKPPVRFIIHYFIRLGFVDGFPGFVLAVTQSYGVLTRYIKLWLVRKKLK